MFPAPKPLRWFPKLDILATCLSSKGRFPDLLGVSPQTRIVSVDDALVQLDQASTNGLRASLDPESLVQLDIAVAALMQGNDTKVPVAEAILNARELGGPILAWNRIIVKARRKGLIRKIADAVWDSHSRIAYDSLVRGMNDIEITRMQGWVPDHILHMGTGAGFRRPGETAEQNHARSKEHQCATWEVGWGIDARCRADPESAAITKYQRGGWRWANAMFQEPTKPKLRVGMAVTFHMLPSMFPRNRELWH
jgi:hypothetical protein